MATSSTEPPLPSSLIRELIDRIFATVHDRIELISIELQEEKFRLIQTFVWISSVIFMAMLSITFASITLVYAFNDDVRIIILGALTGVYIVVFIATLFALRNFLARQPRIFADTIEEIKKDKACILNKN